MKILITTANGQDKGNYIKCLRQLFPSATIVGADMNVEFMDKNLNAIEQLPSGNSDDYVPALLQIIDNWSIDLVIPCSDPECIKIDANLDQFSHVNLLMCKTDRRMALADIFDKTKCARALAGSEHISVPETYAYSDEFLSSMLLDSVSNKVIIKPNNSYGSRGLMLVTYDHDDRNVMKKHTSPLVSMKTAKQVVKDNPDTQFIIQEYWSGPSINVECLVHAGELVACVPHLRTGYRWGRIDQAALIADSKILNACNSTMKLLGIVDGVFNLEVNYTDSSRDMIGLIEVNPRVSAVHAQCRFLGYDMIKHSVMTAMGHPPVDKFVLPAMIRNEGSSYRIIESDEPTVEVLLTGEYLETLSDE